MGLIAELLDFVRARVGDGHVSDATVDPGGGPSVTARHFACPGDDSRPLPGDFVATSASGGAATSHVTGYLDSKNEPAAAAGEKRIYSRDSDGAVVAMVWLKNDGAVLVDNGSGSIELAPGGNVTINGVTIDTDGNVSAPGEVTAMDAVPATAVKLSTHMHPTAMGPSGSPTPGT